MIAYGVVGCIFMLVFGAEKITWISFLAGYLIMLFNYELLKRIGAALKPFIVDNADMPQIRPPKLLLGMLVMLKIMFWGIVLAFLSLGTKVHGIPFVFGMLSIMITAIALAIKEWIYARA